MNHTDVVAGRRHQVPLPSVLVVAIVAAVLLVRIPATATELRVEVGKSLIVPYHEKIATVSIANDSVADVVAITARDLVVIGKQVGTTTLAVWGESQQHVVYDVRVNRNFDGQQILLQVQVGEVNKNRFSELGIDVLWDNDHLIKDSRLRVGTYGGQVLTPSVPLSVGEGVSGLFQFIGKNDQVSAIVHALEEKGGIKMLATPKLLSLSGEQASFLAGGEIPVPVAQTSAGGLQTITIQWREYGVRLKFTPTVIDSNLVNLIIEPEVSNLDYTNAVTIGGFSVPALQTRRAKATVELHSGEAMFLGGLNSQRRVGTIKRIPILGHIPLLGALFTRKDTALEETELVLIVSPRLVGSASAEAVPALPWNGEEVQDKDPTD